MKKFNRVDDGDTKIEGLGLYECINMNVYIETDDHAVISHFKKELRKRKKLKMLEFRNEENQVSITGPYMIEKIEGNNPTYIDLKKV